MDTLIQVAEKRVTQSRDLKPGDIISQDYLDTNKGEEFWTTRQVRLDTVQAAYMAYRADGLTYLVPVVVLHGWDSRRGQRVRIVSTAQRTWETQRVT